MLIPKKDRDSVYQYLYSEGVLVAKKDFNAPRHPNLNMPNLHVLKSMQSLESRGYVKSQFSWQYFYYFLTDKGIEFLQGYLHIPVSIVPKTLKREVKPAPSQRVPRPSGGRERGPREERDGGRRDEYRRAAGEGKESGPSGSYAPKFTGGFGRGRSMHQTTQ